MGDRLLHILLTEGSLPLLVGALVVSGLGAPLPEDVTLLAAGAVTHASDLPIALTMAVCFAGVLAGDLLLFSMARRLGPHALEHRVFRRLLPPERLARIERFVERRGGLAVLLARHVAGLRAAVFAAAGIHGMPRSKFVLFDALGACISVPLMVTLGYFFTAHLDRIVAGVGRVEHYVVVALASTAGLYALVAGIRILARRRRPAKPEQPPVDGPADERTPTPR